MQRGMDERHADSTYSRALSHFNLSYLYKAENMRIGLGGAYDAAQTYLLQTLYPSFCPNGRLAVLPDDETASKGGLH